MEASAVVFAYHDVGVRCLSVLLAHGVRVALVVTHRDDPRETIWFESVEKLARANEIEVAAPEDPNAPQFLARISDIHADFLFSFYYRHMLSPALLATARRGAYNMHGSLLPKYRGRVPVNWAVLKGERATGATLHEMVAKPDAGRIVDQLAVPILPDDRAIDVFRKVTVAAEMVLDRALPGLIDGTAALRVQDLSQGGYFGGRKADDGRIDWTRGAREIHDLVRAVAPPYPGAFTDFSGARLRLLRTRLLGERTRPGPASLHLDPQGRLVVHGADGGVLQVLEHDVDGKPGEAADLRGHLRNGPQRLGAAP
jgi:methionyl-tRNA formyltransferase